MVRINECADTSL